MVRFSSSEDWSSLPDPRYYRMYYLQGQTTSGCSISSLALSFRAPQDGCLARSAKIAFSMGSSVAWENLCGRRLRSTSASGPISL